MGFRVGQAAIQEGVTVTPRAEQIHKILWDSYRGRNNRISCSLETLAADPQVDIVVTRLRHHIANLVATGRLRRLGSKNLLVIEDPADFPVSTTGSRGQFSRVNPDDEYWAPTYPVN